MWQLYKNCTHEFSKPYSRHLSNKVIVIIPLNMLLTDLGFGDNSKLKSWCMDFGSLSVNRLCNSSGIQ